MAARAHGAPHGLLEEDREAVAEAEAPHPARAHGVTEQLAGAASQDHRAVAVVDRPLEEGQGAASRPQHLHAYDPPALLFLPGC